MEWHSWKALRGRKGKCSLWWKRQVSISNQISAPPFLHIRASHIWSLSASVFLSMKWEHWSFPTLAEFSKGDYDALLLIWTTLKWLRLSLSNSYAKYSQLSIKSWQPSIALVSSPICISSHTKHWPYLHKETTFLFPHCTQNTKSWFYWTIHL